MKTSERGDIAIKMVVSCEREDEDDERFNARTRPIAKRFLSVLFRIAVRRL